MSNKPTSFYLSKTAGKELKLCVPTNDQNITITNEKLNNNKAFIGIRSIGDIILDTQELIINTKRLQRNVTIVDNEEVITTVRVNSGTQIDLSNRYCRILSDIKSREPAFTYTDQDIDTAIFMV